MLLCHWLSWWHNRPHLEAEDRLGTYTTALLADSGWKVEERDTIINGWRTLAEGNVPKSNYSHRAVPASSEGHADYQYVDPDDNTEEAEKAFWDNFNRVVAWANINLG